MKSYLFKHPATVTAGFLVLFYVALYSGLEYIAAGLIALIIIYDVLVYFDTPSAVRSERRRMIRAKKRLLRLVLEYSNGSEMIFVGWNGHVAAFSEPSRLRKYCMIIVQEGSDFLKLSRSSISNPDGGIITTYSLNGSRDWKVEKSLTILPVNTGKQKSFMAYQMSRLAEDNIAGPDFRFADLNEIEFLIETITFGQRIQL